MDIILGLDVSTACIGLTLAKEENGKIDILEVTHFRLKVPSKIKGTEALFHKSSYFSGVLETYKDLSRFNLDLHVTKVVIEEPLVSSNNSETVSTLLRFNGMISQSVYSILNVIPEFISSYDARKKKGDVYPLSKIRHALKHSELVLFGGYDWNCAKKEILWNKISEMFPNIHWVYDKKQELKKENFDASDSLVCVIGYVRKQIYKDCPKPQVVEYKEQDIGDGKVKIYYITEFCGMKYTKIIELY